MSVGFVGLGNMGSPMARRLLDAGHRLVGYDPDTAALGRFDAAGGAPANSPAEVAHRSQLVLCSLPSPAVLETVALGTDGLAAGDGARIVVDLSTVGAPTTRRVAGGLAEADISLVDAPVSGGVGGAEKGSLALMVAGATGAVATATPYLEQLGRIFVVGDEPGQGQLMKLLNNYLSATALAATSEALVFGVKAGLEPETVLEVVNAGTGRNSATQDKFPRAVLPGTFDFGFSTEMMLKDIRLFADQADELGVPLWVGTSVKQMWQHVRDQVGGEQDFTTVVQPLEAWAGVQVRAKPSR